MQLRARPRLVLGLLALSACGGAGGRGPSNAAPDDVISFPTPAARVGDRATKAEAHELSFVLQTREGPGAYSQRSTETTTTEVLEVQDGEVSRAKVTYVERSTVQEDAGQRAEEPQPLLGRSYLVTRTATGMAFSTATGQPVSPEEQAALAEEHDGTRDQEIAHLIAGRTWRVGEAHAANEAELAMLNESSGAGDEPLAEAFELTLTEVDATTATFAVAVTMRSSGGMQVTITPSGVATIERARTRPLRLEMSGPLTGTGFGLPVTGTMSGTTTWTY